MYCSAAASTRTTSDPDPSVRLKCATGRPQLDETSSQTSTAASTSGSNAPFVLETADVIGGRKNTCGFPEWWLASEMSYCGRPSGELARGAVGSAHANAKRAAATQRRVAEADLFGCIRRLASIVWGVVVRRRRCGAAPTLRAVQTRRYRPNCPCAKTRCTP